MPTVAVDHIRCTQLFQKAKIFKHLNIFLLTKIYITSLTKPCRTYNIHDLSMLMITGLGNKVTTNRKVLKEDYRLKIFYIKKKKANFLTSLG